MNAPIKDLSCIAILCCLACCRARDIDVTGEWVCVLKMPHLLNPPKDCIR